MIQNSNASDWEYCQGSILYTSIYNYTSILQIFSNQVHININICLYTPGKVNPSGILIPGAEQNKGTYWCSLYLTIS